MRRVLIGDMIVAAQALRDVPAHRHRLVFGQMLARAHAADKWRKRLGRIHPCWGNGSLMALALPLARGKPGEDCPPAGDAAFLSALRTVVEVLEARQKARDRQSRARQRKDTNSRQ